MVGRCSFFLLFWDTLRNFDMRNYVVCPPLISLSSSRIKGTPCSARSKISIGLVRLPAPSIFNFSQIWGSGVNGASPSVRQRITRTQMGRDPMTDHMVV